MILKNLSTKQCDNIKLVLFQIADTIEHKVSSPDVGSRVEGFAKNTCSHACNF